MTRKLKFLAVLIALTTVFTGCNKKVDYQKEEEQVKILWEETSSFAQNGDWENYTKCWSHSPNLQVLHPGSREWLKGWEEFASVYENRIKSLSAATMHKNEFTVNVNESGDMAWGIADVTFSFNPENVIHMWETVICEKVEGEWKIVSVMASPVPDN